MGEGLEEFHNNPDDLLNDLKGEEGDFEDDNEGPDYDRHDDQSDF